MSGWHPSSLDFSDYTTFGGYSRRVEALSHPVCHLPPPPFDSHFCTASEAKCADVQARFPEFVLESDNVFYVGLPGPDTGSCAHGLGPLYRRWNPATNDHWFTADSGVRGTALNRGYVPEGYGEQGVAECVLLACSNFMCE